MQINCAQNSLPVCKGHKTNLKKLLIYDVMESIRNIDIISLNLYSEFFLV